MSAPRVPEIPGGQVRTYKSDEYRFGLTAEIRLGAKRLCQLHVLSSRANPESQVASIACEHWAADEHTRAVIEQCIVRVLSLKSLSGIQSRYIELDSTDQKTLFLGPVYAEVYNTREITRVANEFFDLVREQLRQVFTLQPAIVLDEQPATRQP